MCFHTFIGFFLKMLLGKVCAHVVQPSNISWTKPIKSMFVIRGVYVFFFITLLFLFLYLFYFVRFTCKASNNKNNKNGPKVLIYIAKKNRDIRIRIGYRHSCNISSDKVNGGKSCEIIRLIITCHWQVREGLFLRKLVLLLYVCRSCCWIGYFFSSSLFNVVL